MSKLAALRNLARFLLLALVVIAAPAHAQVSAIESYCLGQLPNNSTGLIAAANVRNCVNYLTEHLSSVPYSGQVSTSYPIIGNFVNISGTVSATHFLGDGSGLTGISTSGTASWYALVGVPTALQNVSNGTVISTTAAYGLTASYTTLYGDGSHLSGIAASSVSGSQVIDVRNSPYNVICDGAAHSGNLSGAQAALDVARTVSGVTVILGPPNVTCVYGTNTTVNLEAPLKYVSNTNIVFAGKVMHNINNGDLFLLEGLYDDITDTQRQQSVNIVGYPGNWIDTVSRTGTQQRKMIGMTNLINGTVQGLYISTSTNLGNFGMQFRNTTYVTAQNNGIFLTPNATGAAGSDGFHITGASSYNIVAHNTIYGDDDACSITQEGATSAGLVQNSNLFIGNTCSTYRFSGMKMFTDGNAVNGNILQPVWMGNVFKIHGPTGSGGNAAGIYTDNAGGYISNTLLIGNVFDCSNGQINSGSGGGSCVLMQNDTPNVRNTTFANNTWAGYSYRGINIQSNVQGVAFEDNAVGNYVGQFTVVTSTLVTSMTYSSANIMRIEVDPSTSLVSVSAASQYYVSTTAGTNVSNTGKFYITSVSDTGHFMLAAADNISSSSDQTGASISASIILRAGSWLYIAGGKDIVAKNNRVDNPPAFTIMEGNSTKPRDVIFMGNVLTNFSDWAGFSITSGWNTIMMNNTCINSTGNSCIRESSSNNVSNSTFVGNIDSGSVSQSRQSFLFMDANYLLKYQNIGTNSDYFNFYPFGTVSATFVSATTASATTLKVATISPTFSVVTPSTAVAGAMAWNTSGTLCMVSGSTYIKVFNTAQSCSFVPSTQ